MSEKNVRAGAETPCADEETVELLIPRRGPDDRAVLIGVNGTFIRVLPGVAVQVKKPFAEAWENARAQDDAAWEARVRAMNASKKALAEL